MNSHVQVHIYEGVLYMVQTCIYTHTHTQCTPTVLYHKPFDLVHTYVTYTQYTECTPLQSVHPYRAHTPTERTPLQSTHPYRAYTPTERAPLQSVHPYRAHPPTEHTPLQSMHPYGAHTPTERTPLQSTHPYRACTPTEHTPLQSTHTPTEHAPLQSTHPYRVYTPTEHIPLQSMHISRVWADQSHQKNTNMLGNSPTDSPLRYSPLSPPPLTTLPSITPTLPSTYPHSPLHEPHSPLHHSLIISSQHIQTSTWRMEATVHKVVHLHLKCFLHKVVVLDHKEVGVRELSVSNGWNGNPTLVYVYTHVMYSESSVI